MTTTPFSMRSVDEALCWALHRIKTAKLGEGEYFAKAQALLELGGWIPVDAQLPDDDCSVLVPAWTDMTGRWVVEITSFRSGIGLFAGGSMPQPTHWRPVPAFELESRGG